MTSRTSFVWLDARDALLFHERLLVLHGGAPGIRDEGLLMSALARPQQHAACSGRPDVIDLAALYTADVGQNHPFIDGNKRTGFLLGLVFLELNGHRFTATQEDAANAVLALAAGRIEETGYAAFLRVNTVSMGI